MNPTDLDPTDAAFWRALPDPLEAWRRSIAEQSRACAGGDRRLPPRWRADVLCRCVPLTADDAAAMLADDDPGSDAADLALLLRTYQHAQAASAGRVARGA